MQHFYDWRLPTPSVNFFIEDIPVLEKYPFNLLIDIYIWQMTSHPQCVVLRAAKYEVAIQRISIKSEQRKLLNGEIGLVTATTEQELNFHV